MLKQINVYIFVKLNLKNVRHFFHDFMKYLCNVYTFNRINVHQLTSLQSDVIDSCV